MNFNRKLKAALDVLTETPLEAHITVAIDEYIDRYGDRCDLIYNHLTHDLNEYYLPQLNALRTSESLMTYDLNEINGLLHEVGSLKPADNTTTNDTVRDVVTRLQRLADNITTRQSHIGIERGTSDHFDTPVGYMINGRRWSPPRRREVTQSINRPPSKPYLELIEIIKELAEYYTIAQDHLSKL